MKVYLDIDNTLIYSKDHDLLFAKHLGEFLTNILAKYDVYWLTTHCDGDSDIPLAYLSRYLPEGLVELLKQIKPTRWRTFKIEAVDLKGDFLWFDDVLFGYERKILEKAGKLDSFVKVDLKTNPSFFKDYLEI